MTLRKPLPLLIVTLGWTLIFANAFGQQFKNERYLINGTIKGIDSGMVRMFSPNGNEVLDSALILSGRFSMRGEISSPERRLFMISPGSWSFKAFVEEATTKLYIDTAGAAHHGSGADKWALIWEIEQAGSELADIYTKYKNETDQKSYVAAISSLYKQLETLSGNKDAEVKIRREADSLMNLMFTKQKSWIESYINKHSSSIAGVYLFAEFFETYEFYQSSPAASFSYLDSMLNRFSGSAATSLYYQQLTDKVRALRSMQTGRLAPDFTLLQKDKSKFTLSSTKGTYTLIDFWASWCIPCRKAIPVWKEVYAQYKDQKFTIVGVSSDKRWEDWIKALDKEQMPWVQVIDEFPNESDPALVTESFGTNSLPFYVLLDKEGKVVVSSNDKDVIRKKIEEIFH